MKHIKSKHVNMLSPAYTHSGTNHTWCLENENKAIVRKEEFRSLWGPRFHPQWLCGGWGQERDIGDEFAPVLGQLWCGPKVVQAGQSSLVAEWFMLACCISPCIYIYIHNLSNPSIYAKYPLLKISIFIQTLLTYMSQFFSWGYSWPWLI